MEEIPENITPIINLTERPHNVNILGRITNKRLIKELRSFSEDQLDRGLAELTITDSSAAIYLVVWRDMAEKYHEGDTLLLKNVSTTVFNRHLQLSLKKSSELKKLQIQLRTLNEDRNISLKPVRDGMTYSKHTKDSKSTTLSGPSSGGFKKGGFVPE